MTHTPAPVRRALVAAALALSLPLGLAACSSAADTAATGSSDGVGARWSSCMRDAGFSVADATDEQIASGSVLAPAGVDQAAFTDQAGRCAQGLGVEAADDAQNQQWAREYDAVASCIRDEYPDFPPQEPGSVGTDGYVRAGEPAFEETFRRCLAEESPSTQQAN